jgi:hypothetical protein
MIQGCLRLHLLKNASNFKMGIEVPRIEFYYTFEEFVCLLLVALLTRFYLSQDANRLIAVFEFVLVQNGSQVKFCTLEVALEKLNLSHTQQRLIVFSIVA